MAIKRYLQNKGKGFYMTLLSIVLCVVTSAVYSAIWGRTQYMSWPGFWFVLGGAALALALIAVKGERFAPSAVFAGSFIGLLLFIYGIYFFISSVVTGIQFNGFPPEFFVTAVLFAITMVTSLVSVFMKQKKD